MSEPAPPLGVASTNATFAQPVQHRDRIDDEVPGDPSEGPTSAIQINRLVHLLARQTNVLASECCADAESR
jgi:hypothetical protein